MPEDNELLHDTIARLTKENEELAAENRNLKEANAHHRKEALIKDTQVKTLESLFEFTIESQIERINK